LATKHQSPSEYVYFSFYNWESLITYRIYPGINLKAAAEQKKIILEKKPSAVVKPIEPANLPLESDETESSWDGSNLSYTDVSPSQSSQPLNQAAFQHSNNGDESSSKPPHSFSTLIFLAIESSSTKALPVRDIYSWITQHFPYYRSAPLGWKNSVRHNLSLNKCFYKVECGLVSFF
jgi:forkhead box protein N